MSAAPATSETELESVERRVPTPRARRGQKNRAAPKQGKLEGGGEAVPTVAIVLEKDKDGAPDEGEKVEALRSAQNESNRPAKNEATPASGVPEDLIARYKKAKQALWEVPKHKFFAEFENRPLTDPRVGSPDFQAETKEGGPAPEFVYVKRSIQEYLNMQVLSLEKTNSTLKAEMRQNLVCIDRLTSRLGLEQQGRGLAALAALVARRTRRRVARAFSRLHLAASRAAFVEQQRMLRDAPTKQAQAPSKPPPSASETAAALARESQLVTHLQAENRRLQVELEDRSRAAELLCKRLLRVDALARTAKHHR